MTIIGYAHVSTDGQALDSQIEALKTFGCEKIFREKISGAKADRLQLVKLLAAIGSGDKLVVGRLDRLARSTRDLLNIVEAITRRDVQVAWRRVGRHDDGARTLDAHRPRRIKPLKGGWSSGNAVRSS